MAPGRADQSGRPTVQHRFRRGDDDHDVRLEERGMDAKRMQPSVLELHEILPLDVMDLNVPVEPPRELRRDETGKQLVPRSAGETARNEQGLVAARNPEAFELDHR